MRRLTLPVLLFLAAPACSEVLVSETTASGSGGSSTGTTSGNGGSESTATTGSAGGAGGSPACAQTHDTLDVAVTSWQGNTYACDAESGDHEFSAAVVDSPAPGVLLLDSCPPNADCIEQPSKLSVIAPDIYINVPKGTFVQVHVSIYPTKGGCARRVQIKNLPSWGGEPNPIESGEALWFFGADGDPSGFPDTPILATAEGLGCFPDEPSGCGGHDSYVWHFQPATNLEDPGVIVPMGETATWSGYEKGQHQDLAFRNLRSYSSGLCDGPVDLAFWMTHFYPLD